MDLILLVGEIGGGISLAGCGSSGRKSNWGDKCMASDR